MSTARLSESFHSANLFEAGMGEVVVSRFKGDSRVEAGVFLVDVFCKGITNAYFFQGGLIEYERTLLPKLFRGDTPIALEASCGRKLVEEAAAYAAKCGFFPHPDYKKAARVFGGIDPKACLRSFTFGKEGKPMYIQGRYESEFEIGAALRNLHARFGEGGYHYLLMSDASDAPFDVEDDSDETDDLPPGLGRTPPNQPES